MNCKSNEMNHIFNLINNFYKSKQWRKKRKYILARDNYMCRECRKYGRTTEANTVHHIEPLETFADKLTNKEINVAEFHRLALEDKNLESLCHRCHNKKHPEKGGKRYPPYQKSFN